MYLTKEITQTALKRVQSFEHSLRDLFSSYGYNLHDNLGRRNALCSQAQEKELAIALSKVFNSVIQDGAPGKPDIYIADINKELECKLTSGNRGSSVSYSLQTDWATLKNKGSLDYLYVLCDKEFVNFCVLYFKDLTINDFYPPANGSRGKSRMKKTAAMKKVVCLHGDYTTQNETFVNNYKHKLANIVKDNAEKIRLLQKKYFENEGTASAARNKIIEMRDRLDPKLNRQEAAINEKINYWQDTESRYSFILKPLNEV